MADHRAVAERVAAKGALREELDVAQAARILRRLNQPSVYYLAIVEGEWPEELFEQWLAEAFIYQLLT